MAYGLNLNHSFACTQKDLISIIDSAGKQSARLVMNREEATAQEGLATLVIQFLEA